MFTGQTIIANNLQTDMRYGVYVTNLLVVGGWINSGDDTNETEIAMIV